MPRRTRAWLRDAPLHVIQRRNNRAACFFADEDYHCYLHWRRVYLDKYHCALLAYVLMTNHVHLLLTLRRESTNEGGEWLTDHPVYSGLGGHGCNARRSVSGVIQNRTGCGSHEDYTRGDEPERGHGQRSIPRRYSRDAGAQGQPADNERPPAQ